MILQYIYTIVMIILLFGVIIFVHELGHFLVARWLGLKVETFSIGMGPALWQRKINGVNYKIGAFPVGGYVALPQMDPDLGMKREEEKREKGEKEEHEVIPPLPPWKKIPVLLAGVTGNVILAFIIALIVFWAGRDQVYPVDGAVIGYIDEESVAYEHGLRMGDRILAVNGNEVRRWQDFIINTALTDSAQLKVLTSAGEQKTIEISTERMEEGHRIIEGVAKSSPVLVIGVRPESSADNAGIRQRDVITHFEGEKLMSQMHMMDLVKRHRDQEVTLTVQRGEKTLTKQLTPEYDEEIERVVIGVMFSPFDIYHQPIEQMYGWISPIFRLLRAFVTPGESRIAAESVGGPISIFRLLWFSIQSSLLVALWIAGLISMNLAVLNILPIPVLDGGHLVFTIMEIIRGRPLPPKAMAIVHHIFIFLLLLMITMVSINDIMRLNISRLWRSTEDQFVPVVVIEETMPQDE